jgi:hypothetical protein
MTYTADLRTDRPGSLLPPLALSILVHVLFALLFVAASLRVPQPASSPFEVEILPPEGAARARSKPRSQQAQTAAPSVEPRVAPPKTQIVSPPDIGPESALRPQRYGRFWF